MKRLIENALAKMISKARNLMRLNNECQVEEYIACDDDGLLVGLEVDYLLSHGSPAPDGEPSSVEVYDITLTINDEVVDCDDYQISKQDFY